MNPTNVAIRVQTDGKAEVKRDMAEMGQSGVQAGGAIADGFDKAAASQKRLEQAADRQMAKWKQMAAAAKQEADYEERRARFDRALGVSPAASNAQRITAANSMFGGGPEGASKQQLASRLNLTRQAADVFTTGMMGMNPGMIAIQQGPQIMDAWATAGLKLKASLIAVTAGLGATAAATAVVTVAYLRHEAALRALDVSARGLGLTAGLTAQQLDSLAASGAAASDIGISQARDLASAYVSTGRITGDVLAGLIAATRDYATTTSQDMPAASKELAAAFADPADGAAILLKHLAFLDPAQRRHIENMAKAGDTAGAQREMLTRLLPWLLDSEKATSFWARSLQGLKTAGDNLLETLAKLSDQDVTGTAAGRLAKAQQQLDRTGGRSASWRAEVERLRPDAEKEAREAAEESRRGLKNQQANDIQALIAQALPEASAIDAIRQRQAAIRSKMDATLPGVDRTKMSEAIAADDKQIEQLKKKAAHVDAHAASLGRDTAALAANTASTLALATAYLTSDQAAARAEAHRLAANDAAKKGASEAQRDQMRLAAMAADAAASGAKQVAEMTAQARAQGEVNAKVAAGTMTQAEAQAALEKERLLRSLLTQMGLADGRAKDVLTEVTKRLAAAQDDLNRKMQLAAVLSGTAASNDNIAQLKLQLSLVEATADVRARSLAQLQAEQDLKSRGVDKASPEGRDYIAGKVSEVDLGGRLGRADQAAQMRRDQADALALGRAELELVGQSASAHDTVMRKLSMQLDLKRQGYDLSSDEVKVLIDGALAIDEQNRRLQLIQDSWGEIRSTGEGIVDTLGEALSVERWGQWGDAGKQVLTDLANEFIKLAALNPLKNALFGGSLPTMSSSGGLIGSVLKSFIGRNAAGTDNWPGGFTDVGEQGKERVWLPPGSKVFSNPATMAMGQGTTVTYNIDATGADAAKIAELEATIRQLHQSLPGTIIKVSNDARARRLIA